MRYLTIALLLLLVQLGRCENGMGVTGASVLPLTIPAMDSANLQLAKQLATGCYALRLATPVHDWAAGTLYFLPTDRDTTLELSLQGNGTRGNSADVLKWTGLWMLMSYADPTRYESYECFVKDAHGCWQSTDPCKTIAERAAGHGAVPAQCAIPDEVAAQFLSPDGMTWCPWREVDHAEAIHAQNLYRITQRFAYPSATIAMHVPYTYTYLQTFLNRLRTQKFAGVTIDELGTTSSGRKLQVIRLADPHPMLPPEQQQTVLLIAGEHATEHAASWVAHGALVALLADTPEARALRANTTWLVIPIEDPDGRARSEFDHLTERFRLPNDPATPPEVFAYARYLADYVSRGRTIDVALSLHNVEANECLNICSPLIYPQQREETIALNREFFTQLRADGYLANEPDKPWDFGVVTSRLYGWCSLHFGSLAVSYEVNDRFPAQRLSLPRLQGIGAHLASAFGAWLASDAGVQWHKKVSTVVQQHNQARAAYWVKVKYGPEQRTNYDLLTFAY